MIQTVRGFVRVKKNFWGQVHFNRPGCMLIKFCAHEGGHIFEVGAYYFPNIFGERFRTFLENNKTRDNKFISPQQDKTMCKSYHESKILFSCSGIMILKYKIIKFLYSERN